MAESDDGPVETGLNERYIRFKKVLGRGSFKTVYAAFDTHDALEVAWNKLHVDRLTAEERNKVMNEVSLLRRIDHKNIIRLYDSFLCPDADGSESLAFITELMMSGTLKEYLKKAKVVKLKVIRRWCSNILEAIAYLHERRIMHRDLKLDNLFINGHVGEVKIGDLGLSAVMDAEKAESVIGTPEFMAPELYEESYTEKVDIYAFGMCLLEMVSMEYPYSECKGPAQIMKKVFNGEKPDAFHKLIESDVKDVIAKCLRRESERPSAAELLSNPLFRDWEQDDGTRSNLSLLHGTSESMEHGTSLKGSGDEDLAIGEQVIMYSETLNRDMLIGMREADSTENGEADPGLFVRTKNEGPSFRISLEMPIGDGLKCVSFTFNPGDRAESLALEMVSEFRLDPSQLSEITCEIESQVRVLQEQREREQEQLSLAHSPSAGALGMPSDSRDKGGRNSRANTIARSPTLGLEKLNVGEPLETHATVMISTPKGSKSTLEKAQGLPRSKSPQGVSTVNNETETTATPDTGLAKEVDNSHFAVKALASAPPTDSMKSDVTVHTAVAVDNVQSLPPSGSSFEHPREALSTDDSQESSEKLHMAREPALNPYLSSGSNGIHESDQGMPSDYSERNQRVQLEAYPLPISTVQQAPQVPPRTETPIQTPTSRTSSAHFQANAPSNTEADSVIESRPHTQSHSEKIPSIPVRVSHSSSSQAHQDTQSRSNLDAPLLQKLRAPVSAHGVSQQPIDPIAAQLPHQALQTSQGPATSPPTQAGQSGPYAYTPSLGQPNAQSTNLSKQDEAGTLQLLEKDKGKLIHVHADSNQTQRRQDQPQIVQLQQQTELSQLTPGDHLGGRTPSVMPRDYAQRSSATVVSSDNSSESFLRGGDTGIVAQSDRLENRIVQLSSADSAPKESTRFATGASTANNPKSQLSTTLDALPDAREVVPVANLDANAAVYSRAPEHASGEMRGGVEVRDSRSIHRVEPHFNKSLHDPSTTSKAYSNGVIRKVSRGLDDESRAYAVMGDEPSENPEAVNISALTNSTLHQIAVPGCDASSATGTSLQRTSSQSGQKMSGSIRPIVVVGGDKRMVSKRDTPRPLPAETVEGNLNLTQLRSHTSETTSMVPRPYIANDGESMSAFSASLKSAATSSTGTEKLSKSGAASSQHFTVVQAPTVTATEKTHQGGSAHPHPTLSGGRTPDFGSSGEIRIAKEGMGIPAASLAQSVQQSTSSALPSSSPANLSVRTNSWKSVHSDDSGGQSAGFSSAPFTASVGSGAVDGAECEYDQKWYTLCLELMENAVRGRVAVVKQKLGQGASVNFADYDKRTPLHLASSAGHAETCIVLIESGANVNARDRWNRTPLADARNGHHDDVINLLRDAGANEDEMENSSDLLNIEMLQFSANGNLDAVRERIASGAFVAYSDYEDRTALHLACSHGHADVTDFLLLNGADATAKDRMGRTPIDNAVKNGHRNVLEILKQNGVELSQPAAVSDSSGIKLSGHAQNTQAQGSSADSNGSFVVGGAGSSTRPRSSPAPEQLESLKTAMALSQSMSLGHIVIDSDAFAAKDKSSGSAHSSMNNISGDERFHRTIQSSMSMPPTPFDVTSRASPVIDEEHARLLEEYERERSRLEAEHKLKLDGLLRKKTGDFSGRTPRVALDSDTISNISPQGAQVMLGPSSTSNGVQNLRNLSSGSQAPSAALKSAVLSENSSPSHPQMPSPFELGDCVSSSQSSIPPISKAARSYQPLPQDYQQDVFAESGSWGPTGEDNSIRGEAPSWSDVVRFSSSSTDNAYTPASAGTSETSILPFSTRDGTIELPAPMYSTDNRSWDVTGKSEGGLASGRTSTEDMLPTILSSGSQDNDEIWGGQESTSREDKNETRRAPASSIVNEMVEKVVNESPKQESTGNLSNRFR